MESKSRAVETIYGTMVLPDDPSDLIGRFLEAYGEWGYLEALLVAQLAEPGARVVDLGAFIGTFGLGMGSLGASQVVAVEPSATSFELLQRNFRVNCSVPYHLVRAAAGPTEGMARLCSAVAGNAGATSWTGFPGTIADPGERVEMTTIQKLRETFGPYDVLKLDVEGYEAQVLEGDRAWIAEHKPVIWAECNEDPSVEGLLEFLRSTDLDPHFVSFPCFRQQSFRRPEQDVFPIAYEAALVGGTPGLADRLDGFRLGEAISVKPIASFQDLREALWLTPRWGATDWTKLAKHELLALVARYYRHEDFSSFLARK